MSGTGIGSGSRCRLLAILLVLTLVVGLAPGGVASAAGGTVSGYKFWDINGNGVRDPDEPGLNGWDIKLEDAQGNDVGSAITGDGDWLAGYYEFTGIDAGTYTVREVMQDGWRATAQLVNDVDDGEASDEQAVVSVGSDGEIATVDFGNNGFGDFVILKYEDANGTGDRDSEEQLLGGWEFTVEWKPFFTTQWLGHWNVVTEGDGRVALDNVPPGNYRVREASRFGWKQTAPLMNQDGWFYFNLKYLSGEWKTNIGGQGYTTNRTAEFGNKPTRLYGSKWNDEDGNGAFDPGEVKLPNWVMILGQRSAQGVCEEIARTATDTQGEYELTTQSVPELGGGEYCVKEQAPNGAVGWQQTSPTPVDGDGWYVFSISESASKPINFGNRYAPAYLTVYKFHDLDGDGIWDQSEEPGIGGWRMSLDGGTAIETGTDGKIEFGAIDGGSHDLSEIVPADWWFTGATAQIDGGQIFSLEELSFSAQFEQVWVIYIGNQQYGIDLDPDLAENYLPDENEHTLTATVTKVDGTVLPAEGVPVCFAADHGPGGFSPTCGATDSEGRVRATLSNEQAGTTVVRAWIDGDGDETYDQSEPSDMAEKVWHPAGTISGHKYEDIDGDGVKDDFEGGLAGWTIQLWRGETKVAEATTGADGSYSFDEVQPGDYVVMEVMPTPNPGWVQTWPAVPGTHSVKVESGQTTSDIDFRNSGTQLILTPETADSYLPGDMCHVFTATLTNADGTKLAGVPVSFSTTFGAFDGGSQSATAVTDSDGEVGVRLCSQTAGAATITAWLDANGNQVVDPAEYQDTATQNWLPPGAIKVWKYSDTNGNGTLDEGDTPLPGWSVKLDDGEWVYTGADGYSVFGDLLPGDYYEIHEDMWPGWVQVLPGDPGYFERTVESGQTVEVFFLNFDANPFYPQLPQLRRVLPRVHSDGDQQRRCASRGRGCDVHHGLRFL